MKECVFIWILYWREKEDLYIWPRQLIWDIIADPWVFKRTTQSVINKFKNELYLYRSYSALRSDIQHQHQHQYRQPQIIIHQSFTKIIMTKRKKMCVYLHQFFVMDIIMNWKLSEFNCSLHEIHANKTILSDNNNLDIYVYLLKISKSILISLRNTRII